MKQKMMGFWDAVASAGLHANNLHLAPDRQPHRHLITQFLWTGYSSCRPTNSVQALKAVKPRINQQNQESKQVNNSVKSFNLSLQNYY